MKKLILVLLLISCSMFLYACGGGTTNDTPAAETDSGDQKIPEKVVIKWGTVGPESGNIMGDGFQVFKKYVEEKSNGVFVVEFYGNGVLGGDTAMLEQLATGTLQIAEPSFSSLSMYNEQLGIPELPFLFSGKESAQKALDGELGDYIRSLLEGTGIMIGGPISIVEGYAVFNNVRPISKPADFANLKIRTQQAPSHIDMFKALKANATPMDYTELFTACQNGTVDGCENCVSLAAPDAFYEVQKYGTDLMHIMSSSIASVSEVWYNSLSDELREIFDGGLKAKSDWQRENAVSYEKVCYDTLEKGGMQMTYLTPEQRKEIREAALPYLDKYIESWGQEIFDKAWAYEN